MPTGQGYLTGRPDIVVGSVPEQDLNAIFYQYSALLNRVARSITRDKRGRRRRPGNVPTSATSPQ
jgi:hypothetical protein